MILSLDTLHALRSTPTVLLDGCFDPLHAGHVAYLQSARQMFPQYRIVVAVAPDQTIREKGREPLLSQETRAAVVGAVAGVDEVFPTQMPVAQVIALLRPQIYVKGKDWEEQLPDEIAAACSLFGVPVVYTDSVSDSSSDALRRWALQDAERGLDRLETFMAVQTETPPERFDREYFTGDWRSNGHAYTLDSRREAEGPHPRILAEAFSGCSMLDVGCGPGYLVEFLRELGIEAGGVDPSPTAKQMAVNRWVIQADVSKCPSRMADVAICREVLEHLTVGAVAETVCDLFRVAKRYVYITTRFSDRGVFEAATDFDTDPTHITCLSQPFLRSLCVLNGGRRRRDLEERLDHLNKGRVLVYEVAA